MPTFAFPHTFRFLRTRPNVRADFLAVRATFLTPTYRERVRASVEDALLAADKRESIIHFSFFIILYTLYFLQYFNTEKFCRRQTQVCAIRTASLSQRVETRVARFAKDYLACERKHREDDRRQRSDASRRYRSSADRQWLAPSAANRYARARVSSIYGAMKYGPIKGHFGTMPREPVAHCVRRDSTISGHNFCTRARQLSRDEKRRGFFSCVRRSRDMSRAIVKSIAGDDTSARIRRQGRESVVRRCARSTIDF